MQPALLDSRDYGKDDLTEQLNRVMFSHTFSASNRHKRFLEHVVNVAIRGEGAKLKGYTIGIDVV